MKLNLPSTGLTYRSKLRRICLLFFWTLLVPFWGIAQTPSQNQQMSEILELLDKGESIVGMKLDLLDINFETGKSTLANSSQSYLDEVATFLLKVPNVYLNISGHTDAVGNPSANQRLSLDRARAVRDYFAIQGIEKERFTIEGHGSSLPLGNNNTAEGKRLNRRVELEVYSLRENVVRVQDLIILADGRKIGVVYAKVNKDSLEYQTFTENFIYTIPLHEVKTVKYADGNQVVFEEKKKEKKAALKVNNNATSKAQENYLFEEFGLWIEYIFGPRIRSKNFADIDISDWEVNGLKSQNFLSNEGRVRLPLADEVFAEATHGLNLGMLVGIDEHWGVIGEYQVSISNHTLVTSYLIGTSYDLVRNSETCIAGVAKLGFTNIEADLGRVEWLSNYGSPLALSDGAVWAGEYISASSNKLSYQVGLRGDAKIRSRGVWLNVQMGLGGTLIGGTRFKVNSEEGSPNDARIINFKDPSMVKTDLTATQAGIKPGLRSMGIYFSIGYSAYFGRKRGSF